MCVSEIFLSKPKRYGWGILKVGGMFLQKDASEHVGEKYDYSSITSGCKGLS